jgi:hypothetical protein
MGEYVPITYVEDTIPHVWWIVSSIEIFLGTCIEYRTGELAGIERIVSSRKTARSISLEVKRSEVDPGLVTAFLA